MSKNQPFNRSQSKGSIGIIFLTVLIDMIGVGIIIPILPALFFKETNLFFPPGTSEDHIKLIYGFLIAAFPFMQFFGAPILGALSDKHGRKPLLQLSLVGTFLGYIILAYGIISQHLILVFLGRLLPGFTGGNISIVYSAMADISKAEEKAKNFGLVGAAFGLGFIIGPALGGILADNTVVSWFNNATPFFVTALLTVLNMVLVYIKFPETLKKQKKSKINALTGFKNIKKAFQIPHIRSLFVVAFLHAIGFSFFTNFFAVYLYEVFDFTQKDVGYLFGYIGVWLVLTQGILVRKLSGRVRPRAVPTYSLLLLSFAVLLVLLPQKASWYYWLIILVPIAQSISNPFITTILSEATDASMQGEMLGIKQSLFSLGTVITPVIGGWLITFDVSYPIITGSAIIFIAWMIYQFIFNKK